MGEGVPPPIFFLKRETTMETTTTKLPSVSNYGKYSSSNYGVHTLAFEVGELTVYFSYTTPVAFHTPKTGLVVSENVWSRTTGKHLNWIDGGTKKDRIPHEDFTRQLSEMDLRLEI